MSKVEINKEDILSSKYDIERLKVIQTSAIDYYRESANGILEKIRNGTIQVVEDETKTGLGLWDVIESLQNPDSIIK